MIFRVTRTEVQVSDVEADNEEEAKMLAWMLTNRAMPVSLSVTLAAVPQPGDSDA